MATVTKAASSEADGTTDGTDLGRWASPTNAFATTGDNTYSTAALDSTKNSGRASRFGFPAFTTGDIPDGSTINSVTATVEWNFNPNVAGSTLGVQLVNAGTPLGTETTNTSATTDTQDTHQVTSGISLADLRSAGTILANVRYRKGNVTTTTTGSLDFVSLTVDYTAAGTPHTVDPADTLSLADTRAFGAGKGLADTLAFSDTLARAAEFARTVPDTLALADEATPDNDSPGGPPVTHVVRRITIKI